MGILQEDEDSKEKDSNEAEAGKEGAAVVSKALAPLESIVEVLRLPAIKLEAGDLIRE